ncbi:MAG: NiRdase protein [Thermodesulfobacteriota bacterium]|nr:NiRdase protein [Thermodesulfobacteriota bacterium]
MNIQDIISRRISLRTYHAEPASPGDLEAVRLAGEGAEALTEADVGFKNY